jgi:hypothetical protein
MPCVRWSIAMRSPMLRVSLSTLGAAGIVACGGAPPPAPAQPQQAPAPVATAEAPPPAASVQPAPEPEAPKQLPTACSSAEGSSSCMLPQEFVDRLCRRPFVDATLALFQKAAPWTRAYLRNKVDAWYMGGHSARATLAFDEEVLVLRFHAPAKGSMVVEGSSGTYDVLRWDGRCYTLDSDEITTKPPPQARTARLQWDRIGATMQQAVLKNEDVKRAFDSRNKACKSAHDDPPPACDAAEADLSYVVARHVRTVGGLPAPDSVP